MAVSTPELRIPSTIRDNGIMAIDDAVCLHCGACVGACPPDAIFLSEVIISFFENCTQCGLCVRVCPVGAIDYPRGHKLSQLR